MTIGLKITAGIATKCLKKLNLLVVIKSFSSKLAEKDFIIWVNILWRRQSGKLRFAQQRHNYLPG